MIVTRIIEIDMGHRVPNHKSKCRNLHGHRYKIEVGVDDKINLEKGISDEGMVIDYGDLKGVMIEVIDKSYDHSLTLDSRDVFAEDISKFGLKTNFVSFVPTAENLAMHWYFLLKEQLEDMNIKINHVTVWETPNCSATFKE